MEGGGPDEVSGGGRGWTMCSSQAHALVDVVSIIEKLTDWGPAVAVATLPL